MFAKSNFIYNMNQGSATKVATKGEVATVKTTTSTVVKKSRSNVETADGYQGGFGNSGTVSQTSSEIASPALKSNVLDAFAFDISREQTPQGRADINRTYRDMYYQDDVCGTAVDLISTLPFSDFTIEGTNEKQTRVYQEACDNLKIRRLFPEVTQDHLVVGAFIGSLEYDISRKNFSNIMVHDVDHTTISPSPYFQGDPNIELTIPKQIYELFEKNTYKPELYKNISKDRKITLKKEDTLFIPRRALSRDFAGVSYFRRALTVWLIQKAHMKGQIDQSYKRQRPIAHLTIGDGVDWEPTPEDMNQIVQGFIEADLDPLGAYVATRPGVNFNEVRNGADYFKWTDIVDSLTIIKLRSLGLSDNFLSAEASYATLEQSLSVTMERFRDFRYMMEREVLYDKVFLRLAKEHGFKKRRISETAEAEIATGTVDNAKYDLPKTLWQKRLMPESDDAYLQILATLEEKGVPISIRAWAAAGGFNIDKLMETQADDIKLRKKLSEWAKEKSEFAPKTEEDGLEEASFTPTRKLGIANRDYQDRTSDMIREPIALDSKGKRAHISGKGRKQLTEKVHKGIASSMSRLAARNNHQVRRNKPPSKYSTVKLPEAE